MDFFGERILLRNMIRYNHINFELIRLFLHRDHAFSFRRRSSGLRLGLSRPILADCFFNVHGLIMDDIFLFSKTNTFVVFDFFLLLITMLRISFVIVLFGLQFGRLITRLRQGVNHLLDALGSADNSGTDFYVSATKVHLGAVAGYNLVWNLTARMTNANQMGLLGFGHTADDDYEVMMEGSVGVLLNRHVAVGAEYRQKPDNLGLGEEDWWDVFVTYIPSKSFNVTLAWAELGSIAGAPDQNGIYLSLGGQLW